MPRMSYGWDDPYDEWCSFYETWSRPYLEQKGAGNGFYEVRLATPKWAHPDGKIRIPACEYFTQDEYGRDECYEWITANRDYYDMLSSVLPRQSESWNAGSSPLVGNLWCDIDAGHCGGSDAAIDLLTHMMSVPTKVGTAEFLLPQPHIIVSGRNGIHVYWLLSHVVKTASPTSEEMLKSILKRLFSFVSGEPTSTENGIDSWDHAFADPNLAFQTATLRPPTSYNQKVQGSPYELRLVRADPSLPRLSLRDWSGSVLPPVRDSESSMTFGDPSRALLAPGEKRRIPKRTEDFLRVGGWADQFHRGMVRAVSDLAWAGYGPDETAQKCLSCCQTSGQRTQVKELVRWFLRTKPDWKRLDDSTSDTANDVA